MKWVNFKKPILIKPLFFGFLLILSNTIFSQLVRVDTLIYKSQLPYLDSNIFNIKYPYFILEDSILTTQLNRNIQHDYFRDTDMTSTLDEVLKDWDGLLYLEFEITYQDNNYLSFIISGEGCGAYCTSWRRTFVYSLKTGKRVSIQSILNLDGDLADKIKSDYEIQYAKNVLELNERRLDPDEEIDEVTYNWIIENYESCKTNFEIKDYSLYPDKIQLFTDCGMPHILLPFTPIYDLSYPFQDLKKYLKIDCFKESK